MITRHVVNICLVHLSFFIIAILVAHLIWTSDAERQILNPNANAVLCKY